MWTNQYGKKSIPGNAHLTPESAARDIKYWLSKGIDIYLAQGGYLHAGATTRQYPEAVRQYTNVGICRALYADVDVKLPQATNSSAGANDAGTGAGATRSEPIPTGTIRATGASLNHAARPSNAYVSVQDLARGLAPFLNSGFPRPTYIVSSGTGGMHLYWTMRELFLPADFRSLSRKLVAALHHYGVKFDPQCTNDLCRLLRVPGTRNFKRDPALPVEVFYDSGQDHDIYDVREALAPFEGHHGYSESRNKSGGFRRHIQPDNGPEEHTPDVMDDLGAGIDEPQYDTTPNNLNLLAEACPFIRDVLDTDIRYDEPLWKHAISLACYTENPEDAASRMSRDPEAWVDKLWQAQDDRERSATLGPPKCATIHADGAQQCDTCPHYALGTTPLHVPNARPINKFLVTHTLVGSIDDLPFGYSRGVNDPFIYHIDNPEPVFQYPIIPGSGYMQNGEAYSLVFRTIEGERSEITRTFDCAKLTDDRSLTATLASQGLPIFNAPAVRKFFMSYMKELRSKAATIITVPPFGWHEVNGVTGFAYDGEYITPSGIVRCHRAKELANEYTVRGDTTPWSNLANIILSTGRPDLAMLIAIGFAAPLLSMTGHQGLLIGTWSSASGIGKSTAMGLAQSIWAKPLLGGFNDTLNYVFQKATRLQHLPLLYDEIKGIKQVENFCDTVFTLTGGKNRGRLSRGSEMRESLFWQTIIGYCSNASIAAIAAERTHGTDASLYRMFETIAIQSTLGSNQTHLISKITELTNGLFTNHGGIGRVYANYLGANHAYILDTNRLHMEALELELRPKQAERYWFTAIGVLLDAAWIAKGLGLCNFRLTELKRYLIQEFYRMRGGVILSLNDYSVPDTIFSELAEFVNDNPETRIITDTAWAGAGRPPKNAITIINDNQRLIRADIQISGRPLTLRFRDAAFSDWCKGKGRSKPAMYEAIRSLAGGTLTNGRIASGSRLAGLSEQIWIIPVTGTPLEQRMEFVNQYGLMP